MAFSRAHATDGVSVEVEGGFVLVAPDQPALILIIIVDLPQTSNIERHPRGPSVHTLVHHQP